jgi:Anti-sigma-K factor rskA
MTANDDDRIAYLSGEHAEALSAEDRADLDELRALLRAPAAWAEPDPGLEDRVVAAIAAEAGATGRTTETGATRRTAEAGATGRAVETGAPEPATAPVRKRRRLTLWRPAYALGAAALAVAVAVVIVVSAGSSGPSALHFAMVLNGTSLAPGAHGNASLTKTTAGWRIGLDATGLPRLADGRYYQAWLKNAQGILVPVGTFNEPDHVTLWAGVPATSFPTLTVTLQQANGNPASSGKRVLVGTIRPRG